MTPWTKRIILIGVYALAIAALFIDKTEGLKVALMVITGSFTLLKGEGEEK